MTPHISDRRRVELALPARMLYRAFRTATDNGGVDVETNDSLILEMLETAVLSAFEGAREDRKFKLSSRCTRAQDHAMREFENRPLIVAFVVVLYWVRDRTDAGDILLIEGSPFDGAVSALIPRLEEEAGREWDEVHKSATKGAKRLHTTLQRMGYFP
ncbi:hypothetical protein UFOVP1299_22 [uncultured Caudovirales phage]|uniref:Uncharacterized protein n=1 Tax=uncultured Caudovirales phage TaxID=2100421 RepID=A0A6J5RMW5_9CAUD|nr:hypothetical protein UFOVP1299_22 [uncultured Caudovirales phage]